MRADGPVRSAPEDRITLALGFTFAHTEINVAIVGTHNPEHMRSNIGKVEESLPIDARAVEDLHERFDRLGAEWRQMG
jgi:aryl-alcohol dehydrogenase-like predicted oxidoreductase